MASTVRLNMDALQRHHRLVNVEELGNIESTLRNAIEVMSKFDSKEKTAHPNKKDLTKVVKFLVAEDQQTEQFFKDCVQAEKFQLRLKQVPFIGHLLTPDGLAPDPGKVETITNMPPPEDVKALKRFLGMVNYLAKFLLQSASP